MNKLFGKRLTQGIQCVAARQSRSIREVEEEIARTLGYERPTVQRWRKGYVPKAADQVEFLVRYCKDHGWVDREWARSILEAAKHPNIVNILWELWPGPMVLHLASSHIPNNLPPRQSGLLGRVQESQFLLKTISSPRWPIISIEGPPGIGKTRLALECAYRCMPGPILGIDEPFGAAVWLSPIAQPKPEERAFHGEGNQSSQKSWMDEVLDTIARVLNQINITHLPTAEKQHRIDQLLRAYRVLIILDNFEAIDEPKLEPWLLEVPEPSKVLITTRNKQLRSVKPVELTGLPDNVALQLIRGYSDGLKLPAVGAHSDAKLLSLVKAADANPQALKMAISRIHAGLSLSEVVIQLEAANKNADAGFAYLLDSAWMSLQPHARSLLLAMPLFEEDAAKEAIGAVAGLDSSQLNEALEQLIELSLLNISSESQQPDGRYSVHPLTRAFAKDQLATTVDAQWRDRARERWLRWYLEFLRPLDAEDWTSFVAMDKERRNLMSAIEWALSYHYPCAPELVRRLWHYLYVKGYWRECADYTRRALEYGTSTDEGTTFMHLELLARQGWLYVEQGDAERALKPLVKARNMIGKLKRPDWQAKTGLLNYFGQWYLVRNEIDLAKRSWTEHLRWARKQGDRRGQLVARYYLAFVVVMKVRRGIPADLEEAIRTLEELIMEARDLQWPRAGVYCSCRLGEALAHVGRFAEAIQYLDYVAEMANPDRWDEPLLRAHALMARATLFKLRKQPNSAYECAQEAQALYEGIRAWEAHDAADLMDQLRVVIDREKGVMALSA